MTHKLCSYTLYQILLFADKNTIIKLILGCKLEQLKDNHWIDIINTYVSGYVSLNRNPKYDLCRILQGMICWQCFKASETYLEDFTDYKHVCSVCKRKIVNKTHLDLIGKSRRCIIC